MKIKIPVLLLLFIAAGSCAPYPLLSPGSELTGIWSNEAQVLEIRTDGSMILSVQKMFGYDGKKYPVLIVPGSIGEREAVELKKCDPRSCFFDIQTLETFELESSWRFIRPALIMQEYRYRLMDDSYLSIEPTSEIVQVGMPADLTGSPEFQISPDGLMLTYPDQRVFSYRRGCPSDLCIPTLTP
jgi:hypothetical protein